jgi:membrane protein DedA with SNARE-associated domain/rhodanese-related sulfurtransferase
MGWAGWIAAHGYIAVAGILLLSNLGLPMPSVLTLILAGAAAHHGSLNWFVLLLVAAVAEECGATVLYLAGRTSGWWLLARLCRVSMDPETCIFRSADFFYKRGARTLLFARFVPGLASMAPPLAGSLNMRAGRYLRFDIVGVLLHVTVWTGIGFFLSPFIRAITDALAVFGHVVLGLVIAVAIGYFGTWVFTRVRDRKYRDVERVSADEVIARLENPDPTRPIVIADVRSHGYYDPGMQRIKNSIRVEPNRLLSELDALRETLATECDIYVYCSCLRDATSVRIAHTLAAHGHKARVVEGGLRSWIKLGAPTEPVPADEMHHLPRFE